MGETKKQIGTFSATMLGVGSMVGAGIFALLGEAAALAGSALWLSFLISGAIAVVSGLSLARLGARYPSAGGISEYLVQGWGNGFVAGVLSVVLYFSGLVGMSLVARGFGSYAAALLPDAWKPFSSSAAAVLVVLFLMLVNLQGAKKVSRLENWIVGVKLLILTAFGVTILAYSPGGLLQPSTFPPAGDILSTVGLTFFAFSGYSIITNTAEDMPDPGRMLPRAMLLSIVSVLALYLLISFAVLGNLSPEAVARAKDFALAEAARPLLGAAGFTAMAVTALISSTSSLNATIYSVTNIAYQMAKNHELPLVFGKPLAHSREGLLFSSAAVAVLAASLDLGAIASVGAVLVLSIQCIVHIGHWRLRNETGASPITIAAAISTTLGATGLALYHQAARSPATMGLLVAVVTGALVVELVMKRRRRNN